MFDDFIMRSALRWNVPESWIRAVIETESSWDSNAVSLGGDVGLMQISPPTARAYGVQDVSTLLDPEANIDIGARILGDLRRSYGTEFRRVYSAYNSGNPDRWETSTQVARNVLRAMANLAKWAGDDAGPGSLALVVLVVLGWVFFRGWR